MIRNTIHSPSALSLRFWRSSHSSFAFKAIIVFWLSLLIEKGGQSQEQSIDYLNQVKPVLMERCFACHGALKQEGGLRLDTAALAIQGGETGAAILPGNVPASPLFQRISSKDDSLRMPPEGEPLRAEQIEVLKKWISQNAVAPANESPERDPREHWAFQPPSRPAVPQGNTATETQSRWQRNPIDAFIAQKHQQLGLVPQSEAGRRVWLRRVSIDLIGLPPTPAELNAFEADSSPDAYDKIVTRLLESPQYGERWGRHWMDIWRYSDWWGLGAEVRNSQKHIWHWRDWIIESLNADKGYDQMLREMLAADELYPNDLDRLRASGFLARQYFKFNRTSWLDETIEHTSKAMLGMTFNCAKCHDHKYDPIAQTDYYRLRAIFEPYQVRIDFLPGDNDPERDGLPRAFDCNLDAETFVHLRGDDRNPDKSRPMEPAVPSFLSHVPWRIEPVELPAQASQPGLRPFVVEGHTKSAQQAIDKSTELLASARSKLAEAEALHNASVDRSASDPNAKVDLAAKTDANAKDAGFAIVRDDFAVERPELWEQLSGDWKYVDGKLVQAQDAGARVAIRLKKTLPENFEAKLRFRTTGGQMWKSVGIAFDVKDNVEVMAYMSAVAGSSKAQIAYKKKGNYVYPPDSAKTRMIELNHPYEMVLQVRGTLINLRIDNELSVAYRLPVARSHGALELLTFDATAEFSHFELKELSDDTALAETKAKASEVPLSMEQARLNLSMAEKDLSFSMAQARTIPARAVAQQARSQIPASPNATVLAREAVNLERLAAFAKAELGVAKAEFDLARSASEKKSEFAKKLADATVAVDAAKLAVEKTSEDFTPLSGSLKTLESNVESEASRSKPFPTTSTGRRSAFAKWMTDPKHPLPARVAVNHIWLRHMGQPLVPTVFDFGRKGIPPTHPELLDWLAVELIESGWSMKHLHRLIVTSDTYRMSSSNAGVAAETVVRDPDNQYYWRSNPIRMEAQVVRDSLLHIAGELDLSRGGPPIPVADENSRRRSIYFVHSHNEHQKFLSMFDDASVLDCYRRAESVVPQQALALENSKMVARLAEKIVQKVEAGSERLTELDFARSAFIAVLSVEPSPAELQLAAQGLARLTEMAQQSKRVDPTVQGRASLVLALLNHNDFVTVR